jgi:hypothetical protein
MGVRLPCLVDGCETLRVGRGYCGTHYQRLRKYGDPLKVLPRAGNSTPRPVVTERTCIGCGHHGPLGEFVNARNLCLSCHRDRTREWHEKNPDRVLETRRRQRLSGQAKRWDLRKRARNLGLDPDVIVAYYEVHHGRCEICNDPPRPGGRDLNMDHDHETGAFRGMLCDGCNNGLGRFRDDVGRMESAIEYLKKHRG